MCTGHTSCMSSLQILSDMQQIVPEQNCVAALSSDKCRDVMCHDGKTGNAIDNQNIHQQSKQSPDRSQNDSNVAQI